MMTEAEFNRGVSVELGRLLREFHQEQLQQRIDAGDSRIYTGSKNFWTGYLAENKRRRFCWTTRPDTNGDYWSFDYVRTWKARSEKEARRRGFSEEWKAVGYVRCAKRRVAAAKALRRYRRYHKEAAGRK